MRSTLRLFVLVLAAICMQIGAPRAKPFQCAEFGLYGIERPEKPSCISPPFDGDDGLFQSCRAELESYRSSMNSYLDCLSAESREATSEFNSAVRSFNCNASGSYC